MNICPECGKRHVVHWPEFWPYRRYNTYYCSFGCIDISVTRDLKKLKDADRKKRERKMKKKDYSEIAREIIRIKESGGGNREIFEYLESIGYENPEGAFYYIRKSLKKSNPELEAKIGNSKPGPAKKEAPKAEPEKKPTAEEIAAEGMIPVMTASGPIRIKTPDAKMVEIETPEANTLGDALNGMADAAADFFGACEDMGLNLDRELEDEEFETTAIRHKNYGEFYYDHDHNCIDWRTPEGDEMSMCITGWKNLIDDLPVIMRKLGVEL